MRFVFVIALLVSFSSCSRPTLEDVTRDQLYLMENFVDLAQGIETEEDARDAVREFERLVVRAKRLKKRYHEVSIPTKTELSALEKQFGERSTEVYGRFFSPGSSDDWSTETRAILEDSLSAFFEVMFEEK